MAQNKPSPFTSKSYPFSKELSSYDAYSLAEHFLQMKWLIAMVGCIFLKQYVMLKKFLNKI